MSFVSKILEHAGHIEKKDVHEQLDHLTHKLTDSELTVHQLLENKYVRFQPTLDETENLSMTVLELQNELDTVERKVNTEIKGQLSVSTGEFQSLNQQLKEAKTKLEGLDYLASIHDLNQKVSEAVENRCYRDAADAVQELEQLLNKPLTPNDDKISILVEMRAEHTILRESLINTLLNTWNDSITWNIQGDKHSRSKEPMTNIKEVSLTVSCLGEQFQTLVETVEGLHATNNLHTRMKTFAERVQTYILPFVLEQSNFAMDLKASSSTKTLKISTNSSVSSKPDDSNEESNSSDLLYFEVFSKLLELLNHLKDMFLFIDYGWGDTQEQTKLSTQTVSESEADSVNYTKSGGPDYTVLKGKGTLMSLLGEEIGPWLLDQLCNTVLAKAVPSNAKDLDSFKDVITATNLLHDKLLELGFIQSDNTVLLKYVSNVNALFANKKCQTTLEEARELMLAKLHDSVAVTEDKPMGEWPPLIPGGVKKSKSLEAAGDHLSDNTLRLPKCRISQNIDLLVRRAYETLKEATESSPECATQMFYTVRFMFEAFIHIVPTHHNQSLETFPQVAALHHNNCMFIAHHLITLGHQFASLLPSTVQPTFVDLIQPVRRTGLEAFLKQILNQKNLLLESLDGAEGFTSVEEKTNKEMSDRAIKQVLLQLDHLQKIWKPILPVNIYKKAMGKLVGAVVERITDCVSSLEDIAQEAAHVLISLIGPVEEQCPQLLSSPGEVPAAEALRHVPSWARLSELKFMLDANLSSIADRWAEGKGPLAASYSPKEVKQMIRALFQNTDRRATVLASIR